MQTEYYMLCDFSSQMFVQAMHMVFISYRDIRILLASLVPSSDLSIWRLELALYSFAYH